MSETLTTVTDLNVSSVVEGTLGIREYYDDATLQELADSLATSGMIQPIVVRNAGEEGSFELVIGSRRLRAAKLNGFETIPATVILDLEDQEALTMTLTENLQREDLTPFEEAWAITRLVQEHGMRYQEVAEVIGKNVSFVRRRIKLLSLPEEVQELVSQGELAAHQVDSLTKLKTPQAQIEFARAASTNALNHDELATMIRDGLKRKDRSHKAGPKREFTPTKAVLRLKTILKAFRNTMPHILEAEDLGGDAAHNAGVVLKDFQSEIEKALQWLKDEHLGERLGAE